MQQISVSIVNKEEIENRDYLLQAHNSFREEILQRETNCMTELGILVTIFTGYAVSLHKYTNGSLPDPLFLLISICSILGALMGVTICVLHGYHFRFALFQLHKIENKLCLEKVQLNRWLKYNDYKDAYIKRRRGNH